MLLVKNIPLNTNIIAELISEPNDLYLVWPNAKFPFDHEQWKEVLSPETGNVPFLCYEDNQLIGHAALCKTENEGTFSLSFLFINPQIRSKGYGEKMITLLEDYARVYLSAKKLLLVVRTYNPRAQRCYTKCGFKEDCREDTLIRMSKILN